MTCPNVPEDVLVPESTWGDRDEYWNRYDGLAARFIENFKLYMDGCPEGMAEAGPRRK